MNAKQPELLFADADSFTIIGAEEAIPASGDILLTPEQFAAQQDDLANRDGRTGLLLQTDTELEPIQSLFSHADVIAVHFGAFADGRGFSVARLLRERFGYTGPVRAVGNFIPDQLHYLIRSGFDSFVLPEGTSAETAERCAAAFTEAYQISWDRPEPLFRRL